MSDAVLVQGNPHDWGSTIFKLNGERYFGVTSITWGEKRNRKLVYGSGRSRVPRGMTNGKYEPGTLKVKFEKASAIVVKEDLARFSSSGKSYGDAKVTATLQYIEYGQRPITEAFYQCAIVADDSPNEEGEDPLYEEIEFQFTRHTTNGLHLHEDEVL